MPLEEGGFDDTRDEAGGGGGGDTGEGGSTGGEGDAVDSDLPPDLLAAVNAFHRAKTGMRMCFKNVEEALRKEAKGQRSGAQVGRLQQGFNVFAAALVGMFEELYATVLNQAGVTYTTIEQDLGSAAVSSGRSEERRV